ncbi:AAA ATPase-like domain-containing protein [Desulfonema limicola]|uniref:AAA ATPase-like domain-containing protein n=1 Tax=Desulfonema limicola TaxID=45656 RepID=A0A975GFR5_9BACT|nr:AAA-like domain-containing protein [Desulfonema limicola]QTA79454.1 AAA ATPase-like domain-containing protein [Desulfonema limicola]
MRRFSSYGPVDTSLHYFVPREKLIEKACVQLMGENPEQGGHYITVWAPRQCGKSWIMNKTMWKLAENERFHVLKLELEYLKTTKDPDEIVSSIAERIIDRLKHKNICPGTCIKNIKEFDKLFTSQVLDKPLILILDEFDALTEEAITGLAGAFRNIYNNRRSDPNPSHKKEYLLHGIALIGVRSVLGIENVKGSPFNVQRSLHIPKLTYEETCSMFYQYEQETGQKVEQEVIDLVFYETQGQPGLVSWFGELLTEGYDQYVPDHSRSITAEDFKYVYEDALNVLPNNTVLNIISKARQEPYKGLVLEFFRTKEKQLFRFDEKHINFLYMNGVIDPEKQDKTYIRFSCPFVQKRLFNYFSYELFRYMGKILEPFEDTSDTITETGLNITNLLRRYERHLKKNREWMFQDAPRRKDLRIYEAVFHFNLYEFINSFLANKKAKVWPEFPTGNGKIDLMIQYAGKLYGLELKSYTDDSDFRISLQQAARYGKTLKLDLIWLVEFVEYIPEGYREKYEQEYNDKDSGVVVKPVFVATGE